MKAKHTPGPWEVTSDPMHFDSLTTVEAGSHEKRMGLWREMIVQVGGWAGANEANANTRLIAAAPDLLAALQQYVEHFGDPLHCANAAIAKATFDLAMRS